MEGCNFVYNSYVDSIILLSPDKKKDLKHGN